MEPITWDQVKATIQNGHLQWRAFFDERQLKEINFDVIYAEDFAHGTGDHNARLIIARMENLLNVISDAITMMDEEPK